MSNSRYLSGKDIKKALSLYNYKPKSPDANFITYSNPNIFNEAEATAGQDPVIYANDIDSVRGMLIQTLIFNMDHNLQSIGRLRRLGETLGRDVTTPLTIWFKSGSLKRGLVLIKNTWIIHVSTQNFYGIWTFPKKMNGQGPLRIFLKKKQTVLSY